MMNLHQRISALEAKTQNNILIGVIEETDLEKKLVKVKIGEILSDWIKYPDLLFDNFFILTTPKKGAKLKLFAPNGNIEQASILSFYFNDDLEAPSAEKTSIVFNSGLRIDIEDKKINISSGEKITLEGDVDIKGKLSASGDISSDANINAKSDISTSGGDVKAGVITLKTHKHIATAPGFGQPVNFVSVSAV